LKLEHPKISASNLHRNQLQIIVFHWQESINYVNKISFLIKNVLKPISLKSYLPCLMIFRHNTQIKPFVDEFFHFANTIKIMSVIALAVEMPFLGEFVLQEESQIRLLIFCLFKMSILCWNHLCLGRLIHNLTVLHVV